uniref:Uncharacterized protein n=1 Tax=Myoviridae sp. ctwmI4 TaxID=2826710 RepID=A0A8S5LUK1_9CAUD|nr:MAG TPA: hypothetical protein [Myoviridae sp. ctwmI4]
MLRPPWYAVVISNALSLISSLMTSHHGIWSRVEISCNVPS